MKPCSSHLAAVALLALAALAAPAAAVNLIPNPGFETLNSCPTGFGQLSAAASWNAPTDGTSDCFNTCVVGWPPFPVPGVPNSPLGFQASRTGNGHAGFIVRNSTNTSYREYLQVPLTSPLVNGQTYTVSFYVNLSDSSYLSVDRIGAYFSVGAVGPTNNDTPLPFTPQVESPAATFLTDTVDWMLISGSFVAAGGEDHMIIGNFHDDANTATQATAFSWPMSYYMIDDAMVELDAEEPQACCTSDGFCQMLTEAQCLAENWTPVGPGSACVPDPCGATHARRSTWGRLKTLYR